MSHSNLKYLKEAPLGWKAAHSINFFLFLPLQTNILNPKNAHQGMIRRSVDSVEGVVGEVIAYNYASLNSFFILTT